MLYGSAAAAELWSVTVKELEHTHRKILHVIPGLSSDALIQSRPNRISLNHLFYLSMTACSVVNLHASALPKQPLVVQVTNPRAVQYEDHPQGNYALLESSD